MFHAVFEVALVDAVGGIAHDTVAIGFVLAEPTFEVCAVSVEDLSIAFFHSVSVHSNASIAITMRHLGKTIHDPSFPVAFDSHLTRDEEVHPLSMPEIVMPFSLVNLSSCCIVINTESVLHLVDEGALVLIAVEECVGALDES